MAISAAIIASVPRSLNRAPIQPATDFIARSMQTPDRVRKAFDDAGYPNQAATFRKAPRGVLKAP
jgi:hypothetical protein